MRKWAERLLLAVTVGLIVVAVTVPIWEHRVTKILNNRVHEVVYTPQQKATHLIEFHDKLDSLDSTCTGTAIGPHAIMTATHCNRGEDADKIMEIDLSMHQYRILAWTDDGRDHTIYLLDGPAFKNYVTVVYAMPRVNDHVYMYGSGGRAYPPRRLDGVVTPNDDPSDVDEAMGAVRFTNPVIPGDSGSAVYNDKGEVVALVTYLHMNADHTTTGVGFQLNFSPKVIHDAQQFDGDEGLLNH